MWKGKSAKKVGLRAKICADAENKILFFNWLSAGTQCHNGTHHGSLPMNAVSQVC